MNALKQFLEKKKETNDNPTASDIKPIEATGSADTFVVVEAMGKKQKTQVSRETLNPLFDKSFNFEFPKCEKGVLELAKIKIELWDYNRFFANNLIGAYEIDLTTVYYQPFHQFHRTWFTLTDPKDEREGLQGYVLANIEVLGPGDEAKVIEKITEDSANKTVVSSKIRQEGHLIIAEVFRAEHVVPMNVTTKNNRLIVTLNYGGVTQSTIDTEESLNPSFNQIIYLQAMLPNHSKNVQIELYDKSTIGSDTLIGTGLIPFNTFKYLDDLPPTWINIYGPPLCSTGKKSEDMARFGAKKGSCYRGRILVRMSSRDHDNPISRTIKMTFKPPEIIVPTPPSKTYTLRIDCYTGQELPGNEGLLHFVLGPYLLKTEVKRSEAGKITWDCTLEKNRLVLPLDVTMIPDLIVYFADKDYESHRKCFFRVKAVKILARSQKRYERSRENPQIVKLREDQTLDLVSDDQFSGFVTVRPVLFACKPPPKMDFESIRNPSKQRQYILKLFVYVARKLPSANDGGISNPFLVARCMGKTMITKTKRYTLNPEWYEVMVEEITIPDINDKDTPNPTLVLMCYHSDDGTDFEPKDLDSSSKKKVLLGRYWLDLDVDTKKRFKGIAETIDIIYSKPKWVPVVYDKSDVSEGKLMISYAIVEKEKYHIVESSLKSKGITGIEPEYKNIDMSLFTIGVRNIIKRIGFYKPIYCSAEIKLSRELEKLQSDPSKIDKDLPLNSKQMDENPIKRATTTNTMISTKAGDSVSSDGVLRIGKMNVVNGGISFNRTFRFRVKAPYNPQVCPVLEVFLFHYPLGQKKLLGAASFELRNVLGFFYGDEDDTDYKKRWKNFFATAEMNQFSMNKLKPPKFKLPKVRPENRLLYLDDMVYKLPTHIKSKKRQKREFWKMNFGGQAVINKLEKWAHEARNKDPNIAFNYMDDLIHPEDLQDLTKEEKKMIQEQYNIIDDEDLEFGLTKQNFTRKYEDHYIQEDEDFGSISIDPNAKGKNQNQESPEKKINKRQENYQDFDMAKNAHIDTEQKDVVAAQIEEEQRLVELMGEQNERDALNQAEMLERQRSVKSESVIDNFALKDFQDVSSLKADVSEKALKYDNVFVKERIESKKNRVKQKKKRKKKKGGLFGGGFSFKKGLNFLFGGDDGKDTDEEEEIDDVPEYLKGRLEFQDDLEDEISDKEGIIKAFKLYRGNKRDVDSYYKRQLNTYEEVATFKCLFLREDKKDLIPISKIKKFLHDMLKERKYTLRVYILKGVGITPDSDTDDLSSYVRLNLNSVVQDSSQESKQGFFPEYYHCFEFQDVVMPGSAYLNIDIIEDSLIDSTLGSTVVDLEQRIFNLSWQKMKLKPVEKRSIENLGKGARGRLEMWIELIPPRQLLPPVHIYPRTQLDYELRVIVWETKDCVFKDEATGANDLYVQGAPKRQIANFKMTDTHWRCRAKGSFNWRWKFKLMLPVDQNKNYGEDVFVVQLWDRDLIARNDLIGEAQIDLNIHKMLKKAHSRKNKVVTMKRRIKGSGLETKKLWFDVFHPDAVDEFDNPVSQGKVCLSFEVVPKSLCETLDNAEGRSSPNFYPTLPDPVGRFSFDIFSPLQMLKEIIGPTLYRKMCLCCSCILCSVVFVFIGYFLLINYFALKLAGI